MMDEQHEKHMMDQAQQALEQIAKYVHGLHINLSNLAVFKSISGTGTLSSQPSCWPAPT